jgi:hypothetical protein
MKRRTRFAWSSIVSLVPLLALSGAGAAWAGLSGQRSFSAVGQSRGVSIASAGDSENGLVFLHDGTFDGCSDGNITAEILLDYDFPTPPHLDIVESVNSMELGTYGDADAFFTDSPQTDKSGELHNDFSTGLSGSNFTFTWDLLFSVDDALVAEWIIEANCSEETVVATEVYPAPTLPGPAVIGAALLLLGIGIATLRSRG